MGKRGNGDGSIYHRTSDDKWVGSITLESGKRKVFYGKTKKEVQEKMKVALYEQQKGMLPATTAKLTVEQFLKNWLETTQKQSVRPRTYERYEEVVRLHIIPTIGRHQLQKLTTYHVESFYAKKLNEGLSPRTVNTFHNVLHKALDKARKSRLIVENVCDLVDPPRVEDVEITPLALHQVKQLLYIAKGHRIEALLTLAMATGMRRGELLGLKWQDIDFKKSKLQVRRIMSRVPTKLKSAEKKGYVEAPTKTKQSRRGIIIIPLALEALKQHQGRQQAAKEKAGDRWVESGLVFCTSIGTPLNPDRDVRLPFKQLLNKAKLPDIRFHDLRHSAATLLLGMGIHPKIVQEILGHSSIAMTMNVYSHVLPTMQQNAMGMLGNIFMENEDNEQSE